MGKKKFCKEKCFVRKKIEWKSFWRKLKDSGKNKWFVKKKFSKLKKKKSFMKKIWFERKLIFYEKKIMFGKVTVKFQQSIVSKRVQ